MPLANNPAFSRDIFYYFQYFSFSDTFITGNPAFLVTTAAAHPRAEQSLNELSDVRGRLGITFHEFTYLALSWIDGNPYAAEDDYGR